VSIAVASYEVSRAVAYMLDDLGIVPAAWHRYRPVIDVQDMPSDARAYVTPGPIEWRRDGRVGQQLDLAVDVAVRQPTGDDPDATADAVLEIGERIADELHRRSPYTAGGSLASTEPLRVEIIDTLVGDEFDRKVAATVVRITYRLWR
jgi:hypothetical protein